jgi:hypothetical protein
MTRLSDTYRASPHAFLGVWEEAWQGRAAQERKAERYRTWLCSQGASRDHAAARALLLLAHEHSHTVFPCSRIVSAPPGPQDGERTNS